MNYFKLILHISGMFLLNSGYLNAQEHKIELGIEGGPSHNYLWDNTILGGSDNSILTASGGISGQFNLSKNLALRSNIFYEKKGFATSMVLPAINHSGPAIYHGNFYYLTMPILLRAGFGKKLRLFVNIGPYFGLLLKQTYVVDALFFMGYAVQESTTINTKQFRRLDVGSVLGFGITVPVKNRFLLSFELRNNLGLRRLQNPPRSYLHTNTTSLLLGVAYKLGTGGKAKAKKG